MMKRSKPCGAPECPPLHKPAGGRICPDAILEAGTWAPSGMGTQASVLVARAGPGNHRPDVPTECTDHGAEWNRSLLRCPHCGRCPGRWRKSQLAQRRLPGDGQPDERRRFPGCRLLLDQPGHGAVRSAGRPGASGQMGLPRTMRGVGNCILGYADGPIPAPKPRKPGRILRV